MFKQSGTKKDKLSKNEYTCSIAAGYSAADPPENCHLNVNKIAKNLTFFQKNFHLQFFGKNRQFLSIFCHLFTFKWQFSGGSGGDNLI